MRSLARLSLIALLVATLPACGNVPATSGPIDTVTPSIVAFFVDFIVQDEIGGTTDYIQSSGQPWVDAPPEANIIIWAPPRSSPKNSWEYLDASAPIKVWWYAGGKLTESEDKLKAIEEYNQRYMGKNAKSNIWAYGYYEFGILSITAGGQEARVYVGAFCGPLCGHGYIYTIQRGADGKWQITDDDRLWIS